MVKNRGPHDSADDWQPSISALPLNSIRAAKIHPFLPQKERDILFANLCENQAAFQCPANPSGDGGASSYLPAKLDVPSVHEVRECLSSRIVQVLPSLFHELDIEPIAATKFPLTFMNGLDGHCGMPHADSIDGRLRISVLYYFHKTPKVFRGGDLEFYEPDVAAPHGHREEAVGQVDVEDNLLVAFPSATFHGITDVRCESNDFADGRFVAVGFLGPRS